MLRWRKDRVNRIFTLNVHFLSGGVTLNIHCINMDFCEIITFHQSDLQSASFIAFQDMRRNDVLCDLTILAGDIAISAHKVIIAAAIPYFRSYFIDHGTGGEGEEIAHLDPGALESLINFAYTSQVTITVENAQSLLLAADFLQVNRVKDACVEFLSKRIDSTNVLQVRTLALNLNILKLSENSDNYIRQNFENFSRSDDFLNLSHSQIKYIISGDDLNVSNEETVFEAVMKWVKVWPGDRKVHLPDLLSEVRMIFLPTDYLIKNVSSDELIRISPQCRDLIQNVQSYHLLLKEEFAFLNLKTQPRKRNAIRDALYGICFSRRNVCSIHCCDFPNRTWNMITSKKIHDDSIHNVAVTNGNIYIFLQSTIHAFDLQAHVWKLLECTHENIDGAAVVPYENNIYCFGSSDGGFGDRISRFHARQENALQNRFPDLTLLRLLECRIGLTGGAAALPYDNAYCISPGGGGFGDRVRCFYTRQEKWQEKRQMKMHRSYCAAVVLGDGIYVTGGLYYANKILATVERYSPSTEQWSENPSMIIPRYFHGCACVNSKLYVSGGITNNGPTDSADMYDPLTNLWSYIFSMNTPRRHFSLVSYNNKIYALGGLKRDGKSSLDFEIYDSGRDTWEIGFSVPEGFQYAVSL